MCMKACGCEPDFQHQFSGHFCGSSCTKGIPAAWKMEWRHLTCCCEHLAFGKDLHSAREDMHDQQARAEKALAVLRRESNWGQDPECAFWAQGPLP